MSNVKVWTREDLYLAYNKWDKAQIELLKEKIINSKWRLGYHIQPHTGLLNDPNGFSFFNDKWHIFYQSYPMGAVHGLKSWYHLTSDNLVDWEKKGTKIFPDSLYDSHGVYSGSALNVDDKLFLAYTGNVRDSNWCRHSYQLGAWMDKDGYITKLKEPLIVKQPKGYTSEFRDPQVFKYKDKFLMIIGAQDQNKKGKILTYESIDLLSWKNKGELVFEDKDMGNMIECPNLIITEKAVLLVFCPQGLDPEICSYDNVYPNNYIVGNFYDEEMNCLDNISGLKNFDEGFDVYATQVIQSPDERILAVSWVGLPSITYPTDQEEWAHCLSIIRELKIKNNRLYQNPVEEIKQLRKGNGLEFSKINNFFIDTDTNQYELNMTFCEPCKGIITLCTDREQKKGLKINFDSINGKMVIDRSNAGVAFGEDFGFTRTFFIEKKPLSLKIFVDSSIVEIFINDGAQVATMRVFPSENHTGFKISCDYAYSGIFWQLRKSIG